MFLKPFKCIRQMMAIVSLSTSLFWMLTETNYGGLSLGRRHSFQTQEHLEIYAKPKQGFLAWFLTLGGLVAGYHLVYQGISYPKCPFYR
jgi:hypothetical protein